MVNPVRRFSAPSFPEPEVRIGGPVAAKGEGDAAAVDPNDVEQGELGDCWLLAGTAAAAWADPSATRDLVRQTAPGRYEVTLYVREKPLGPKVARVFTVDDSFPAAGARPKYAKPGDMSELWVMLIERAAAQEAGGYAKLNGGQIGAGLSLVTPGDVSNYSTTFQSQEKMLATMARALEDRRPVVAGTIPATIFPGSRRRAEELGVVTGHAYAVVGVDENARTVTLQNPWGIQHATVPIADFNRFFTGYAVGSPK